MDRANMYVHDHRTRLETGSPYRWLATAAPAGVSNTCPNQFDTNVSAAERAWLESGTHVNTGFANPCWSGGNLYEGDNIGSAESLAGVVDLDFLGAGGSVEVTPDGDPVGRLPSNSVVYSQTFQVTNTGPSTQSYDLLAAGGAAAPAFLTIDSIRGTDVTAGAEPDSARLSTLGAGAIRDVVVCDTVGDVAAGCLQALELVARQVGSASVADTGFATIAVVRPNLSIEKDVTISGPVAPGAELTYVITLVNDGSHAAAGVTTTDILPAELQFKIGSVTYEVPSGTVTVSYSDDEGDTWTYEPASGGCGAPAGFDACVTNIRWFFSAVLAHGPPDNEIVYGFTGRIP
jgi:uncharacterized repeat protein (TIGR01451 family)